MQLKKQLSKLTDAEFKILVEKETAKRTAKAQKKKLLPRPKEISSEEFKALVDQTKTLFLGKKIKRKAKFVLDVEVIEHIAWITDEHPSVVAIDAQVACKQEALEEPWVAAPLNQPWVLENLDQLFSDYFASEPDASQSGEDTSTSEKEQFGAEIKQLIDTVRTKEKQLGLSADALWDAIYDRCAKYSQG